MKQTCNNENKVQTKYNAKNKKMETKTRNRTEEKRREEKSALQLQAFYARKKQQHYQNNSQICLFFKSLALVYRRDHSPYTL